MNSQHLEEYFTVRQKHIAATDPIEMDRPVSYILGDRFGPIYDKIIRVDKEYLLTCNISLIVFFEPFQMSSCAYELTSYLSSYTTCNYGDSESPRARYPG